LGSDVPFFLQNSPALATGRGEKIAPMEPFGALRGTFLLLVHPGFGVSTPWAYAQLAYYKAFIVQYEDRMATHCKQAADEIHRDLLNASDKYDENGKEKRVSILEAEIEADDAIVSWRRQQRRHEIFSAQAKQERDAYQKLVEQMSRIHTMRQDEWEQSGQKIGRGRPGS